MILLFKFEKFDENQPTKKQATHKQTTDIPS